MASASTRRIFPITDWAAAHEALYPDADNDSSIGTLPCPSKPGESSSAASTFTGSSTPAATSSTTPSAAPSVFRRESTNANKKYRSMSLPWRPKSTILPLGDDLDARFRGLSVVDAPDHQEAPVSASSPRFENWAGFGAEVEQNINVHATEGPNSPTKHSGSKGKGKKSMSGMWRRASVSIKKGLVNLNMNGRRTSIATETFQETTTREGGRQLQSKHAPSRSHQLFLSPSFLQEPEDSCATVQAHPNAHALSPTAAAAADHLHQSASSRPTTGQAINATWHRLRKATSTSFSRHSRILHPDFSLPLPNSRPHEQQHQHQQEQPTARAEHPYEPSDDLYLDSQPLSPTQSVTRPGQGSEPPIIPRNSGSGARAAVAAWHNEMLLPLKNKRLTLDSSAESGIGIPVVASSDSLHVDLDACVAPSRIDFVDRLPLELAIQVLAHLDARGLSKASRVSKTWNRIVSMQHIWRDSYLRENTGTYATTEPITPGTGLGVPAIQPDMNWKDAYQATAELAKRWKQGKASSTYLHGHSDSIYCLQFDEYKIITGSRDKTIRIWDMKTMECKLVIGPPEVVMDNSLLYDEENNPTHSANFEPHTGANSRQNRVTSVPTTVSFQTHHKASILCLQYDEDILVTGSSDASCIVYDMKGGYRPIRRLQKHEAAVLDLCFDDKHIVTCSKDVSICVWDRATGELLKQLRGHSGPVNAVQMRGNTIVSCSGDFRVKLWNIETGKQIREFQGHTKGLACSQFSEDGRYIASAGNDKVIRIWDANTGECLREMKAHESLVRSLHIDSVSGRLVSGSYDTDIKVFDMETGRQMLDFPRWHASWVLSAKSDYRRIVSTGQDPKILVMDFGAGVRGIEKLESHLEHTRIGKALPDTPPNEREGGFV